MNLLLIVSLLILQLVIPPGFFYHRVKPDFLLIYSVIIGLVSGIKHGTLSGFTVGLLQDLFLDGMFGIFTIVKTFVGGLAGLMEGLVFKEKIIIPPFVIFFATIAHETLLIFLSEDMLFSINYLNALKFIILPEALLNALIGLIFYYIYYKINLSGGNNYEQ
ncbi:MAG: rod shape-determining protein MreD [Halanaerobiaceae bacterium]